jgi:GPH family glycoside/pentoside/hexuronide:cation symporter
MEKSGKNQEKSSFKHYIAYGFAQFSDMIAYQSFTLLIFTFYYTNVGLEVPLITLGFIIWSIWNSFNDPLMGYISDKTHTKWGRRRPYIILSIIPLAIVMVLLFTPPIEGTDTAKLIYFIIIICIFDVFYTMYNLNHTCMFPEIFIDPQERIKAMNIKQIIGIIGLLVAFVLPSFIIEDLTDPASFPLYRIVGLIIGIIVIIGASIFLIWGPRERLEFSKDYEQAPSFWKSLKIAMKNKSFMWFIVVEVSNWFVFGMLPTIVPIYGKFVLHITDSFQLSLLLGETFICGALFISVWKWIVSKIGPRKTWMISQLTWIFGLIPLMFISTATEGFVVFAFIGIGLSGSMLNIDLILGDVVDEDEFDTGARNEGGYWGVTAFFMRLATILVFLSINTVLDSVGWQVYDPKNVDAGVLSGLRILISLLPSIFLGIGILGMFFYPLHGKRLAEVRKGLEKIHLEKISKTSTNPTPE